MSVTPNSTTAMPLMFGLKSIHDWILLIATLARGDASTAITMHHAIGRRMAQTYSLASTNLAHDVTDRNPRLDGRARS